MLYKKTIGVVIPCYNVSGQIKKVIETMPDFVDYIICVDDKSDDNTGESIENLSKKNSHIILLSNEENQGVGGAIGVGYVWARNHNIDVTVVMAGDGQMDPVDLPDIIEPVATGKVDYTKGNRFYNPTVIHKMPLIRLVGNIVLSFLTKIASGYWHIADSQSGYSAISLRVLKTIDLTAIYKRYGMPNDLLVTLNIFDFSVIDIPINPLYGVGEKSGIRIHKVIFSIGFLITRLFFKRMILKYVYKSFHPLVLLYLFGFPAFLFGSTSGITILFIDTFYTSLQIGFGWMIFFAMLIISGYFSIVMAMFMDMEYNNHLFKRLGQTHENPSPSTSNR